MVLWGLHVTLKNDTCTYIIIIELKRLYKSPVHYLPNLTFMTEFDNWLLSYRLNRNKIILKYFSAFFQTYFLTTETDFPELTMCCSSNLKKTIENTFLVKVCFWSKKGKPLASKFSLSWRERKDIGSESNWSPSFYKHMLLFVGF